jgi:tetratricopeptide (TPR) repeat protein
MAHSRPPKGRASKVKRARRPLPNSKSQTPTPAQLLNEATAFLHTGDPEAALPLALRALVLSQRPNSGTNLTRESLPALKLLAEINLELGDAEAARAYFLQAVDVDPEGEIADDEGGGAEKFLWLAQLCEEGGEESVRWFEKGAGVLRREIAVAEEKGGDLEVVEEKKKKLAGVLCGIIEVYMTDLSYVPSMLLSGSCPLLISLPPSFPPMTSLYPPPPPLLPRYLASLISTYSFDSTAETRCTTLITSALALAPNSPTPHQTHASILISQSDIPAARAALRTSLSLWQDLPASHPDVLDFPSRISLSRLLLEVGMEEEALEVLSGVVEGDETSVEGWYLGGWGLWLMAVGREEESASASAKAGAEERRNDAEKMTDRNDEIIRSTNPSTHDEGNESITHLRESRVWLKTCLTLAAQLDYEDDRLRDHAQELVQEIERLLLARGVALEEQEEEGEEWEGIESDEAEAGEEEEEEEEMVKETTHAEKAIQAQRNENEKEKAEKNQKDDVIMSGI